MDSSERFIIEITAIGNSLKVSSIDPTSGIETFIIAPRSCSEHDAKKLAIKKLLYLIAKNNS
jgi:hypothetical protein